MDSRKEIMDAALDGLVYQALDELAVRDEAARQMDRELAEAIEELVNDTPLDEKTRTIVNNYTGRLTALTAKHYRYLYVQGAKDCVAILRELGVIK